MSALNLGLAIAATSVLLLGLASGYVKNRLWVSEPLIAMLIGILAGPAVFGVAAIELPEEQQTAFLLEFARITLAISIMGAALRLPPRWETAHWREMLLVLGLGMPLMWLSGTLVSVAVLGLPILYCLLLGAVLSPTDPVLADSIVTGKTAEQAVPERMRHGITAESGANDGLAVLFVLLAVYLLESPADEAISHWLWNVVLGKVVAGIALGLVLGWLAARAFLWVMDRPHAEHPSILTLALALSIAVLAIDQVLDTAALLAVFVAGLMFNRTQSAHEKAYYENMQNAIARFFDIPIFILLGALLPWQSWGELGWRGIAFAGAILLLRRMPAWLLMRPLFPSGSYREAAFSGWFGPIGIAAIYYAVELQHLELVERSDMIWQIVSLVVFASVILHGISATPLTKAFGGRPGADPGASASAEDCHGECQDNEAQQPADEDRAP
jgi:sodium/hydrogen antiporter